MNPLHQEHRHRGDAFVRKLVTFGRILREAGLEVGPGRMQDALLGLAAVDLSNRDDVYWALRTNGPRKLWLFGASCTFYCAWDWRFLGLLLFSAGLDYFVALNFERTKTLAQRRALLALSLVLNLGFLAFFALQGFLRPVEKHRSPGMDGRIHIAKIPLVSGNLSRWMLVGNP